MEQWQRDYIDRARQVALDQRRAAAMAGSENVAGWSNTDQQIFDAYWDEIGLNDALNYVLSNSQSGGDVESVFQVNENDPAYQQFRDKYGDGGTLRMSLGRPVMYGQDWSAWSKDPNQIIDLGDGRFVYNEENINSDAVNALRDADSRSGLNLNPVTGTLFVLGAGTLGNMFLGAEGLGAAGQGVIGGVSGLEPITVPALDAAPTLSSIEGLGTAAGTATTTAAGGATGLLNTVAIPEAITIPASTITAPTLASLPNVGGSNAFGAVGDWFNNLHPMAQRAIVAGAGQGASAILAGRRQESQQNFARQQQDVADQRRREEEDRARREREIRGTPTAMQFNVTPRPGLIGSRIGGR